MPSDLAPLCPTCFERVVAWSAASCASCRKSSPVAACDDCLKSRAGSFLPVEGGKAGGAAPGGAQRFLCVDCIERTLEGDVSERMRDSILAVGMTLLAIYWARAHPVFIYLLFGVTAVCLTFWWLAVRNRREPALRARGVRSLLRRRVERAIRRRERSRA